MNIITQALFFGLLKRHPSSIKSKLRYCNPNDTKTLSNDPMQADWVMRLWNFDPFNSIDATWLLPILSALPSHVQRMICSILPSHLTSELSTYLSLSPPLSVYPRAIQSLSREWISNAIGLEEGFPVPLFIPTTWSSLLKNTKTKLYSLIEMLAISDLARPMKQVIDGKKLSLIRSMLSPAQKERLQFCMQRAHRYPSLSLSEEWLSFPQKLAGLLPKIGIQKLSIALSIESKPLQWYVAHRLLMVDGKLALQQASKQYESKVVQQVQHEMVELIQEESCS